MGKNLYSELTTQKLQEAISLIHTPEYDDIPIRFEVSLYVWRGLRERLSAPSTNAIFAAYTGIPVVIDEYLPDGIIIFVYKTSHGERRELKLLNLEANK